MHAYRIKDPQTFSSKDMKMHDSIIGIYKNALSVFNAHCSLAMGILDTRNKQPMDRYGALDQRTQSGDLFIRKIARFFGLDPENKRCYSSYSSTNFEKLQNTILLMKDVSDMATAQTAFEKARAEQISKEKETYTHVKKGINHMIDGASQQNSTKYKEKE